MDTARHPTRLAVAVISVLCCTLSLSCRKSGEAATSQNQAVDTLATRAADSLAHIRWVESARYRQLLRAELTNPDKNAAEVDLMCEMYRLLTALPNGQAAIAIREAAKTADKTKKDSLQRRLLDSQLVGHGFATSDSICDAARRRWPPLNE